MIFITIRIWSVGNMKWGFLLGVVLLTCGILCWGLKILDIPEYDGMDRVHELTNKNYKNVMKKYDVMVIYYHKAIGENRMAKKQFEVEELALEVCLRVMLYFVARKPACKKKNNNNNNEYMNWLFGQKYIFRFQRLALKRQKSIMFQPIEDQDVSSSHYSWWPVWWNRSSNPFHISMPYLHMAEIRSKCSMYVVSWPDGYLVVHGGSCC